MNKLRPTFKITKAQLLSTEDKDFRAILRSALVIEELGRSKGRKWTGVVIISNDDKLFAPFVAKLFCFCAQSVPCPAINPHPQKKNLLCEPIFVLVGAFVEQHVRFRPATVEYQRVISHKFTFRV